MKEPSHLAPHPYCRLTPPLDDVDFELLKSDIRQNGLRHPIVTYCDEQGIEYIVDGRGRFAACQQIGIECPTTQFIGNVVDLLAYMMSVNVYRRHLTKSQIAMIVAALPELTNSAKAELAKVSLRYLNHANQVQREGVPELQTAVLDGKVGLNNAVEISKHPQAMQRKAVVNLRENNIKKVLMQLRHAKSGPLAFKTELLKIDVKKFFVNTEAYRVLLAKAQFHLQQLECLPEVFRQLKKSAQDIEQHYVLSKLRTQLIPYLTELRKTSATSPSGVESAKALWDDVLRQIGEHADDVFRAMPQSQYGTCLDVVLTAFQKLFDDLEIVVDTIGDSPIEF